MSDKSKAKSVFVCNGATGHSVEDREINDYYATDPIAGEWLLKLEPQIDKIWENACGGGHLAEVFRNAGKLSIVSDLIDRGYKIDGIPYFYGKDFLTVKDFQWVGDIVTNPPFINNTEWVTHSLDCLKDGHYLALFMKIQFLEGKSRRELFEKYPPIRVWVSSSRINCAKGGDFVKYNRSSATCYCWFIWRKGYKGSTEIKWFN